MKIYDWPTGPYPARVRIALAEKNLQSRVRFETVDLYKGEHKTPANSSPRTTQARCRCSNSPTGPSSPNVRPSRNTLMRSMALPSLTGRTPREKGLIHMMSKRAELELLDAVSVYFHHATPGLGPAVEIYQNAEWGLRQRDKALRGMHYFDGILKRQPFVAGEAFSMADITVIGGLIFAGLVELPMPAACEALQAWYARMQERHSVKNRVTMSEPTGL